MKLGNIIAFPALASLLMRARRRLGKEFFHRDWKRTARKANDAIERGGYVVSVALLAPLAGRQWSGYGKLVRKAVARAPVSLRPEVRQLISERILPLVERDAGSGPDAAINAGFVYLALEENQKLYLLLRRNAEALKAHPDFKILFTLAAGHLAAIIHDPDGVRWTIEMLQLLPRDNVQARRASTRLMQNAVSRGLASGNGNGGALPLLAPGSLELFVKKRSLDGASGAHLPDAVQSWLKAAQVPAERRREGPTRRILVVSDNNWNFLQPAVEALCEAGYQVRYLPFHHLKKQLDAADASAASAPRMPEMVYAPGPFMPDAASVWDHVGAVAPWAKDLVDWSDLVFVEWWNVPAIWFSRYLPDEKKLVVRLHSYEAFSIYPTFSNLARVDLALFIAPHMLEIFTAAHGFLYPEMRAELVQNIREGLGQLSCVEKTDSARRTLGMMQYADVNKDPVFALEVLQILVQSDIRWTMKLAGKDWPDSLDGSTLAYKQKFERLMNLMRAHVQIDGYVRDKASWFSSVGFILSTSHREGSHESVVEGMSSGAVPLLRRWPLVSAFGAPESVFPGVPAFSTPQEMAEYAIGVSESYDEASKDAKNLAKGLFSAEAASSELVSAIASLG